MTHGSIGTGLTPSISEIRALNCGQLLYSKSKAIPGVAISIIYFVSFTPMKWLACKIVKYL